MAVDCILSDPALRVDGKSQITEPEGGFLLTPRQRDDLRCALRYPLHLAVIQA